MNSNKAHLSWAEMLRMALRLGWRNIWRQRKRSLLVMGAAAVGSLGVLITLASMHAFFDSMIYTIIDAGMGHVQIRPLGYERSRKIELLLPQADSIAQSLENSDLKSAYAPRLEREGIVRIGSYMTGLMVTGIDPEREPAISRLAQWSLSDRIELRVNASDREAGLVPCMLGRSAAREMELLKEDTVVVSLTGADGDWHSVRCRITELFQSPNDTMDKFLLFMRREDVSQLALGHPHGVSMLVVRDPDRMETSALKEQVGRALLAGTPAARDWSGLQDWHLAKQQLELLRMEDVQPSMAQFLDIVGIFQFVNFMFMFLGFAMILYDATTMAIFERQRELGFLRALGTPRRMLAAMVLMESSWLGLLGSLLGIIPGVLMTIYFNIYGLSLSAFAEGMESMGQVGTVLYPYLTFGDVMACPLAAIVMANLASLHPMLRVLRMRPVDAIQGSAG